MANLLPVVLYHGGCRDGQCAAWVASKAVADAVLIPVYHGDPPPELDGPTTVYLVDFCYPREWMKDLMIAHKRVVVLDHHQTAQAALLGLVEEVAALIGEMPTSHEVIFDMDRSGAGITWDYFSKWRNAPDPCPVCGGRGFNYTNPDPAKPKWGDSPRHHRSDCSMLRPWPVNYVEDRDLWRWGLPSSREVNAYIASFDYEPSTFDSIAGVQVGEAAFLGHAVRREVQTYAAAACSNACWTWLDGHHVPTVTACQHQISEVLEKLMDLSPEAPFVVGWWRRADGRFQYSLRSRGEFDVSVVAKNHGGGGHKNAAGFEGRVVYAAANK